MWALIIFSIILTLLFSFAPDNFYLSKQLETKKAEAFYINFFIYRNAVFNYISQNPSFTGVINTGSLSLPDGWQAIGNWNNYVDANYGYVYGQISYPGLSNYIKEYSCVNGIKIDNNTLFTSECGNITVSLPTIIPNGYFVSVFKKK